MVHQHFKLVECFTVLDNIIMGVEPCKGGFLQKKEAREKVVALSEKYGLMVDPDAWSGHHRRHAAAHRNSQDALP
jgi:simple sugar transport system ATP-binding protein